MSRASQPVRGLGKAVRVRKEHREHKECGPSCTSSNMTGISVRRIQPGEGELFRDLRLAALRESPHAFSFTYESAVERSPESWRDQADSSATGTERCTLIAFAGGRPVGLGAAYRDGPESGEAELVQFWVRPEWRNRGAGRALLEALVSWCGESGVRRVRARVTAGNDRAARFYERQGFVRDPEGGTGW